MAVKEDPIAARVRAALAKVPAVEEKRMFGGIAFMVDGKMCVCAGKGRLLCRIDPARQDELLARKGCEQMMMKGRAYDGYLFVYEDGMKTQKDFDFWMGLALDFNKTAKAAPKKKKK